MDVELGMTENKTYRYHCTFGPPACQRFLFFDDVLCPTASLLRKPLLVLTSRCIGFAGSTLRRYSKAPVILSYEA